MQFAVVECGTDKRICAEMGRQDGVFLLADGKAVSEAKVPMDFGCQFSLKLLGIVLCRPHRLASPVVGGIAAIG